MTEINDTDARAVRDRCVVSLLRYYVVSLCMGAARDEGTPWPVRAREILLRRCPLRVHPSRVQPIVGVRSSSEGLPSSASIASSRIEVALTKYLADGRSSDLTDLPADPPALRSRFD